MLRLDLRGIASDARDGRMQMQILRSAQEVLRLRLRMTRRQEARKRKCPPVWVPAGVVFLVIYIVSDLEG
jgi:hypothetical protein